jgi:hypothetical protein
MMKLNFNEENVIQNIKCPKMKQILNKDMPSQKLCNTIVHIISLNHFISSLKCT